MTDNNKTLLGGVSFNEEPDFDDAIIFDDKDLYRANLLYQYPVFIPVDMGLGTPIQADSPVFTANNNFSNNNNSFNNYYDDYPTLADRNYVAKPIVDDSKKETNMENKNNKDNAIQQNKQTNTDWINPLKSFYITSNYGYRIHPIQKTKKFHDGIDLRAKLNTPVYAVADGEIEFAGLNGTINSGYGKYIRIDHGNGLKSFYAHLNDYNVSIGQKVKKGQQIGISGNTGGSQAPHLHFGIKKNGKSDNPLKYLPKF